MYVHFIIGLLSNKQYVQYILATSSLKVPLLLTKYPTDHIKYECYVKQSVMLYEVFKQHANGCVVELQFSNALL